MPYCLSFSNEFFYGEVDYYEIEPSKKPTSVLQAIISLSREVQIDIAVSLFGVDSDDGPLYIDNEGFPLEVLELVKETDTCTNLDSPIEVWIDEEGNFRIEVYDNG